MKRRTALALVGVLSALIGITAFWLGHSNGEPAFVDPRTSAPFVKTAKVTEARDSQRSFTGFVAARVQSNLAFRVPGKIITRFVDVGQQVKGGQPLMRIDPNDLRLAVSARQNAVSVARAAMVQAEADEKRYARLSNELAVEPPQRYEQAKASYDAAVAQVAAAEAQARIAENEVGYTTLYADADGTIVETLGEPGQVVAAGQTVMRLAHAGPREAVVALPETIHPEIGSMAAATMYGADGATWSARLRQLSDAADPQTRTYEARYVLEGTAANAPLGATVTIRVATAGDDDAKDIEAPIGAIFDSGKHPGVWVVDESSSTVHFRPVNIHSLRDETAILDGVHVGETIVALGAHLLSEGATVRTSSSAVSAR